MQRQSSSPPLYPQSAVIQKYYVENSRNEQFVSFKSPAVLSSVIKPHTILFCPNQDVNLPFVQHILPTSLLQHLLAAGLVIGLTVVSRGLCSSSPYFT